MTEGLFLVLSLCLLSYGMSWGFVSCLLSFSCLMLGFSFNFEMWDLVVVWGAVGGDIMSVGLIYLSWWVICLMFLAGQSKQESVGLMFLMLSLGVFLFGVFGSLDFMSFYLMFEGVLIPMVVLISGWGYQPERLSAGIYLLMYTVFCSIPLLLLILYYRFNAGFMSCYGVEEKNFCGVFGWSSLFWLGGVLAFLVKIPVYGLHLWLPKAHVEAPVLGSMLLAGVLLKLGGYGLMRFCFYVWASVRGMSSFLISLSIVGGIYLSLACLRQTDLSSLVAYSSVVHMGLVVGGICTGFDSGWTGAYVLMVGHGLCSSGLFYYAGVSYSRLGSRSVLITKGFLGVFPSSALFWFLFVSSNMSFPPSLGLLGELFLVMSLVGFSGFLAVLLVVVGFLVGVYCLYLYSWTQHGRSSSVISGGSGLTIMEGLVSLLHWFPLNCLFLSADLF